MLHLVAGALQSLMRGAHDVEPQAAAETFQHTFTAGYGEVHPQWQDSGWQAATAQAHSHFKFLFVYLHAPHHQVLFIMRVHDKAGVLGIP